MTNSHGQLMRSYIDLLNENDDLGSYKYIDRAEDTPIPDAIKPALLELAQLFDDIQELFSQSNQGKLNSRNYNPLTIFQTNIKPLAPTIISKIDECESKFQEIANFKFKNHEDPFFEEPLYRKVRYCVKELIKKKSALNYYLTHLDYMSEKGRNPLQNERERILRKRLTSNIRSIFDFKNWDNDGNLQSDLTIQDTLRKLIK
jgi:hypothetical protein